MASENSNSQRVNRAKKRLKGKELCQNTEYRYLLHEQMLLLHMSSSISIMHTFLSTWVSQVTDRYRDDNKYDETLCL